MLSWLFGPTRDGKDLLEAIKENKIETAISLINAGANPNTHFLAETKLSALHLAVIKTIHASTGSLPIAAARAQWLDLVERLVDAGADRDYQAHDGNTPLHVAVDAEDEALTILLTATKYTAVHNKQGETALHLTANHKNARILTRLLRQGFLIDQTDAKGNTLLHRSVIADNPVILSAVLLHAAKQTANRAGQTPLRLALDTRSDFTNPESWRLSMLLIRHSAANADLLGFYYALQTARAHAPAEIIDLLLNNITPDLALQLAVAGGDIDLLTLCLSKNANVNWLNSQGRSALFMLPDDPEKSADIANKLIAADANVNQVDHDSISLLHHYTDNDRPDILKLLIPHARADLFNAAGKTAIQQAADKKRWHLIPTLAQSREHIDDTSIYSTVLLDAARANATQAVAALCKMGVPAHARDGDYPQLSALHYAALQRNYDMVKALLYVAFADTRLRNADGLSAQEYLIKHERLFDYGRLPEAEADAKYDEHLQLIKLFRDREFINNPQNTHLGKLEQSVIASINRLFHRYGEQLNFTTIRAELNTFIATLLPAQASIIRAVINPQRAEFITAHSIYYYSPLQVLGLIWLAMHDSTVGPALTAQNITDRRATLITQLRSIYLSPDNFYCPQGAMNRIVQTLEGSGHPDIGLEYDAQNAIETFIQSIPDGLAEALKKEPLAQQNQILKTWNTLVTPPATTPAALFLAKACQRISAGLENRFTVNGRIQIARCEIEFIRRSIMEAALPAAFHPLCAYYNQLMVDRGSDELFCAWLAQAIYPKLHAYYNLDNPSQYEAHYQEYREHIELYKNLRILALKEAPILTQLQPLLAALKPVVLDAVAQNKPGKLREIREAVRLLNQMADKDLVSLADLTRPASPDSNDSNGADTLTANPELSGTPFLASRAGADSGDTDAAVVSTPFLVSTLEAGAGASATPALAESKFDGLIMKIICTPLESSRNTAWLTLLQSCQETARTATNRAEAMHSIHKTINDFWHAETLPEPAAA